MLIILLAISLLFLLVLGYKLSRDIVSPCMLFIGGFFVSTSYAIFYQHNWGYFGDLKFFFLVFFSNFAFLSGTLVMSILSSKNKQFVKNFTVTSLVFSKEKVICVYGFLFLIIFATYNVVYVNTGNVNLFESIGQYYLLKKYDNLIYSPFYIKVSQYLTISIFLISTFSLYSYLFIRNCLKISLCFILLLSALSTLLEGTRNTFLLFIWYSLILFFLFKHKISNWKDQINLKLITLLFLGICFFILLFNISFVITGRLSDEYSISTLLSTYLGAPLKNLELFIQDNFQSANIFAGETLMQSYIKLKEFTGDNSFNVESYYDYRWIGNVPLGNVYTILMPLYSDFGFIGCLFSVFILGVVIEMIYLRVKYCKSYKEYMRWSIIYSYISFPVFMSFFSAKVFEMFFSISFVYVLICFFLLDIWLNKIKFKYLLYK